MRNLIYQFWQGNPPYYAKVSSNQIKEYANYIGVDYRCDINKPFFNGVNSNYMNCLRPIHDPDFEKYDKVLFLDMDIFLKEKNKENIFDLNIDGIGMVQEVSQLELREKSTSSINTNNDKAWAKSVKNNFNINVPIDSKNRPLIYNSGVVMYSKESRIQAREWITYQNYRNALIGMDRFYQLDQNYLGAVVFSNKTKFTELDKKWNSQVYYIGNNKPRDVIDNRTEDTVFVHLQTRPRDILNDDMIYDIVNKPVSEWRHR